MAENVILIVWDAARYDYVEQHAPNLAEFSDQNVSFSKAIAPSGWSIPSHVSMFSGQRPLEHKQYRMDQKITSLPLLEKLTQRGYSRYGISANVFLSPKHGFDEQFDEFYGTNLGIQYPEAFNPLEIIEPGSDAVEVSPGRIVRSALQSDHKLKSLTNVAFSGFLTLCSRITPPPALSHKWFSDYPGFNYRPEENVRLIKSILQRESDQTDPFFIFVNFFDTHHPYSPSKALQEEHVGRTLAQSELEELAELSHPFTFLEAINNGDVSEDQIKTIRDLYKAEVRASDNHLSTVFEKLNEEDLRDDTMVIVVGDHGENLGDVGPFGNNMMGHERSGSDSNHHVPLVIIHPELGDIEFEHPFNIRHIFDIIMNSSEFIDETESFINQFTATPVISQTPVASRTAALRESYPSIDDKIIDRSIVVGYEDDWRVALSDQNESAAFKGSQKVSIEDSPNRLVNTLRNSINKIDSDKSKDLDDEAKKRLEKLGYL